MYLDSYGWMIAAGLFFLLACLILFSPIRLNGYMSKHGKNDEISFQIRGLYGLLRYHARIPIVKMGHGASIALRRESTSDVPWMHQRGEQQAEIDKDKVMSAVEKMQMLLQMFHQLELWMHRALGRVHVLEWRWNTSVGTGDAMWTAMATGAIWSVKTSLLGLLSQRVKLQAEPHMTVRPIYQQQAFFRTEWSCKAKMSLWDAIVISLQLVSRLKKTNTSFKQLWKLWKPNSAPAP